MSNEQRLPIFPISTAVNTASGNDSLQIGNCDLADLAAQYGTPLYLYDAETLEETLAAFQHALDRYYAGETGITYAGKAYLSRAMAEWTQRHKIWLDCTGVGELQIAAAANVPKQRLLLHGVNKSEQILSLGVEQVGTIVVDNLTELGRLAELAVDSTKGLPDLWLRFKPGTAVSTHSHIQTGQHDSKFGMSRNEIIVAAQLCRDHNLPLKGLHFHLGSQFREPEPLAFALERTLDLAAMIGMGEEWTICPGGGWGVAYHEDDLPQSNIDEYVRYIAEQVVAGCRSRQLTLPKLQLEPGRSLVARAGVAIYKVGTVKQTGNRRWLLLDGGLADNPRFAMYQARYSALAVKRPFRPNLSPVTFAGPFCESGDILIEGLPFPEVAADELIAVPVSGAYQLSMGSNYNGATRPAVLWVEDGVAQLIQERETAVDLLRRDKSLIPPKPDLSAVPFRKYHGLGNDYIVVSETDLKRPLTPVQIQQICHRQMGIGADGILLDCSESDNQFTVRIFNPDGTEAEKSGNGLRIFSRYLWDMGRVHSNPFEIQTKGGVVEAQLLDGGKQVTIIMGHASFDSHQIPVQGDQRDVLNETMMIDGDELTYCAVTLGNPHCVVLCDEISATDAKRWGPHIETAPRFPNRTNVQFMKILDRNTIQMEIWERGAGYTLASGSSSCAVTAVAYRLGLCEQNVTVHMPGGTLQININDDFILQMSGPVVPVWQGVLSREIA